MGTVGICTRFGERPEGRKEGRRVEFSQTRNTVRERIASGGGETSAAARRNRASGATGARTLNIPLPFVPRRSECSGGDGGKARGQSRLRYLLNDLFPFSCSRVLLLLIPPVLSFPSLRAPLFCLSRDHEILFACLSLRYED